MGEESETAAIGVGPADPPRLELPMADVDPVVDHRDPDAGARRRPGAVAPGDPRVGRRRVDLAKAPRVAVFGVALVRAGQRPKARGPGSGRRNPDGRGRIGIGGRGIASDHAGAAATDATGRKHRQGRPPRRTIPPAASSLQPVPACSSPAPVCPASDASYPCFGSTDASTLPERQRRRNRFGLARPGPGRNGSYGLGRERCRTNDEDSPARFGGKNSEHLPLPSRRRRSRLRQFAFRRTVVLPDKGRAKSLAGA